MMRSILVVLVFVFTVSTSGQAQQQNAAETRDAQTSRLRVITSIQTQQPNAAQAVYSKWRQEASADAVSRLRHALATVTRRNGAGEAEVEFWIEGRTPQAVFEIRPLYFEKLPNGEFKQEQIGDVKKSVVKSIGEGKSFGMGMVFPVSPNANGLEIKFMGYEGGNLRHSHVIEIWLRDEPSESLTTTFGGQ
jgi:hypothetical protein